MSPTTRPNLSYSYFSLYARTRVSLPRMHRMACGESTRAYGNRMDNMWALRAAFAMARGFRDAQDAFCAQAEAGLWDEIQSQAYPEDYRWEVLVDVLRGRAKVSCLRS